MRPNTHSADTLNRLEPNERSLAEQANTGLTRGDQKAARVALEALVGLRPDNADYRNALGNVLKQAGQNEEAAKQYQECLTLKPNHWAASINFANALLNLHRHQDAMEHLKGHLADAPEDTEALYTLGYALQQLGQFKDARDAYDRVLVRDPYHARSLAALLTVRDYGAGKDTFEKAKGLLPKTSRDEQVRLSFALGAYAIRSAAYDDAFMFYDEGNKLLRQSKREFKLPLRPPQSFLPQLDRRTETQAMRPLFILGLPRSGTSLLDQMLACHSEIGSAGEINVAVDMIKAAVRKNATPSDSISQDVRAFYLAALRKRVQGSPVYAIDKSLDLPLAFPELKALFPEARFVVMSRDLRDVALSCYTTAFNFSNDYTTDFGHFFDYADMVTDFLKDQSVGEPDVLPLRYEDLVHEPRLTVSAVLKFLGLPFEETCLNHHKAERVVRTESFWQVRQPVYTSAIGRWHRCEAQLQNRHPKFSQAQPSGMQSKAAQDGDQTHAQ